MAQDQWNGMNTRIEINLIPPFQGALGVSRYSCAALILISVLQWGVGCSTLKIGGDSTAARTEKIAGGAGEIETFRANDPQLPEIPVPEFDNIPEDVQPMVQKWLNYFQGRGREHMERYLARSTRYEGLMKRILRDNDIPEDIIYIALIESGFSPRAISRARAVGYWQFIRGTGKRYGLAINTFVDERRDPVLATQAAADYFKGLYGEFNSWFLSMASYNVGEGRVRREMNRTRSRDFWEIAKRRRLPKETVNYVPKFLAARLIARNPEAYGFKEIPYEPPIEFETAHFNQAINMKLLADKLDIDYAEIKRLNPKYRGEVAPLENSALELRLPLNMKTNALAVASEVAVKDYVFIPDRGETDVYKVRRGDTLLKIARHFRTTVAHLREINDFRRRSRLRPGRTIFVPIPAVSVPLTPMVASKASERVDKSGEVQVQSASLQKKVKVDVAPSSDEILYSVQEGESLAEVATKNNMTMEELMELNNFSDGQTISVGMQLKVKKILPESGEPSVDDLPSSVAENDGGSDAKALATANLNSNTNANATANNNDKTSASPSNHGIASVSNDVVAGTKSLESPLAKGEGVLSLSSELQPTSDLVAKAERDLLHKVQPGETLYGIAQRYNTTVSAIQRANKLRRRRLLRAGALLKIPKVPVQGKNTGSSTSRPSGETTPFGV